MNSNLKWCLLCATLALVLSIPSLLARYKVEAGNQAVELVIEYPEVEALAAGTGRTVSDVLIELKSAGLTGVVVIEDTITTLLDSGRLTHRPAGDAITDWAADASAYKQLQIALFGKFNWRSEDDRHTACTLGAFGKPALSYRNSLFALGMAGVGIDRRQTDLVQANGLTLIGRVSNYEGADLEGIEWTLKDLKASGCSTVVFLGMEVLGSRELIKETAAAIKENGLSFGFAEFGKQWGDERMLREIPESSMRLHSILPAEMTTMSPVDQVERYVRAAKERDCRILYLRLLTAAGPDPVQANADYIRTISSYLNRLGMAARTAHPMATPTDTPFTLVVAIVAPFLGGIALFQLLRWPLWIAVFMAIPGLIGEAIGIGGPNGVHALMASILFPTVAVLAVAEGLEGRTASQAVLMYLVAAFISFCGALAAAAMISTLPYMVRAEQAFGIKLTHVMPVLIVGLVLLFRRYRDGGFGQNIKWWHLAVALIGLVVVALLVIRTGNEGGSVSGFEIKLRSALDKFLTVRPRTKELLFGHPIFIAGLLALAARRPRFVPLLLAAGAIGQASIVNTFSHIHTPLAVSLLRVVWGVTLGGILGAVVYTIIIKLEPLALRIWKQNSS